MLFYLNWLWLVTVVMKLLSCLAVATMVTSRDWIRFLLHVMLLHGALSWQLKFELWILKFRSYELLSCSWFNLFENWLNCSRFFRKVWLWKNANIWRLRVFRLKRKVFRKLFSDALDPIRVKLRWIFDFLCALFDYYLLTLVA